MNLFDGGGSKEGISDSEMTTHIYAKINEAAISVRGLLEIFENKPEVSEIVTEVESSLVQIESEIGEITGNAEQDREILNEKLAAIEELHQRMRDMFDKE
ncbi:hypothetical protein KKB10_00435 [Patescibacteria group bacterium]|nr:hypothetical protein [Patescibacteria group bacterium]MBU1075170.1 hypothetical protein [Patescibacteria group bacterium]MBU1951964.1 hypothetical protein [Patescibacteria group bacterium]